MTSCVRLIVASCILSAALACGSSPAPPSGTSSTSTTSIPAQVSLTGNVTSSVVSGVVIGGATITISDGPNAGKSTTANSSGSYRFDGLTPGNANLVARASGYEDFGRGVFIDGVNTLNFPMRPVLFVKSGAGDSGPFTIPAYIMNVRIQARFTGFTSTFRVFVAGFPVIAEPMGTAIGVTTFDTTRGNTAGSTWEVANSPGIEWTFTEVR